MPKLRNKDNIQPQQRPVRVQRVWVRVRDASGNHWVDGGFGIINNPEGRCAEPFPKRK